MKILSVCGPLGSGKSTFIQKIIQHLQFSGFDLKKIAYVVNDEGNFVGKNLTDQISVFCTPNECFTCNDPDQLKDQIHSLQKQGFQIVFLEGLGLTDGFETLNFLKSTGYDYQILSLLSGIDFEIDKITHSLIFNSFIRVATLGIYITKAEEISDEIKIELSSVLGKKRTPLLSEEGAVKSALDYIESSARGNRKPTLSEFKNLNLWVSGSDHHHDHKHGADCGCENHRHSSAHGIHGAFQYTFALKKEVSHEEIHETLCKSKKVLRAKWVAENHLGNFINKKSEKGELDFRDPFLFIWTKSSLNEDDLKNFELIIWAGSNTCDSDEQAGYQKIRTDPDTMETVKQIKRLLKELPSSPIIVSFSSSNKKRVITHPEKLQVLKEIARRPKVINYWYPRVLKKMMEYWIACAKILLFKEEDWDKNMRLIALKELSVSMVWWQNRYDFGEPVREDLQKINPTLMLEQFVLNAQTLNNEPERAKWQAQEFIEVLRYGRAHGVPAERIIAISQKCIQISIDSVKDVWCKFLEEL
jgi:G3E family GTPase